MKRIIFVILLLVIIAAIVQFYRLYIQYRELKEESLKIDRRVDSLMTENKDFQANIEYFSNPENLEKEFRNRFNYAKPGEKMMIVAPKKSQ